MQNGMTFFLILNMIMQNGILGISVGSYCIRPSMYPAVRMGSILYQQKLFITQ